MTSWQLQPARPLPKCSRHFPLWPQLSKWWWASKTMVDLKPHDLHKFLGRKDYDCGSELTECEAHVWQLVHEMVCQLTAHVETDNFNALLQGCAYSTYASIGTTSISWHPRGQVPQAWQYYLLCAALSLQKHELIRLLISLFTCQTRWLHWTVCWLASIHDARYVFAHAGFLGQSPSTD